ncbi:ABC transporter ATP-binding protein [Methanocella sp. CWC-04]|uniref:ABC transporter ATP-binding protein n=1 Tax=Methanooceanicella nereidis TaxID=2052831 RepID=A0AAP2RFB3_9EURY|nr:ABC transporter ATP-binding protein [Methanocella sp. CWC-04]MCD1296334.1 ABC transporter ATP-binding protein [Methanocella sp. CWC-04]
MIRTENLTKIYDGVRAVDSLSLEVKEGEVFGFLGPNGAGKTTAIGMMVGLIEPAEGKCLINGVDVIKNPLDAKRMTGYLPDGVGFYAHLSARQNLKYFSKFYDMESGDADRRIAELLDYVGLAGVEKPAGSFSRGMRQRLGLAQALLNDPEIIFMDEPTNGLDPQGVMQFRHAINDLARKGKTIFFSSHIMEEVQQVCNTIGIITKGKLIASGTIEDVKRKMSGSDRYTILIKVAGDMPKLADTRIMDAVYNNGSAVIESSIDIRDDISTELYGKGVRIREQRLVERSLEDVFLETVYGGA